MPIREIFENLIPVTNQKIIQEVKAVVYIVFFSKYERKNHNTCNVKLNFLGLASQNCKRFHTFVI